MRARAEAAPPAAASHPRAFGRTSNVWQYLDGVQERLTPPAGPRRRARPLAPLGGDASDGDESPGGASARSRSTASRPSSGSASVSGSSRSGSAGRRSREPRRSRLASKAATRASVAGHGPALAYATRGGAGLPELQPGGRAAVGDTAPPSLSPSGPPVWRRRAAGERARVNVSEVMRNLHALGASASAPSLPAPWPAPAAPAAASAAASPPGGAPPTQPTSPLPASGGGSPTVAPPAAAVSDAEKLRNDFNAQRTRLSYGCSVALELFNGHVMMVASPGGQVRVQSLERLQALPQVKGYKDRAVFTLLNLSDPRSASSIRFGDAVWLQLSVGTGESSWEQGGVLGAKVREAPQLRTLALSDGPSLFRGEAPAPAVVGLPVPVRAYLPKSRDDGDLQMDEIQSRVRNKASKMLGKWVVRSAVRSVARAQIDNFVYNNDEVYLEQDWFYLGADSDAGVAVLRQLPSALSATAGATADVKDGEYVVERRAAWRVRLLDSSAGAAGLSLAQQQMERLLLRAKTQLKHSRKMRLGQTRVYPPGIHGGAAFPAQLRDQVGAAVAQCDDRYLSGQLARVETLRGHLNGKARAMDLGAAMLDPQAASRTRRSVRREAAERLDADADDAVTPTQVSPTSSRPGSGLGSARRRPTAAAAAAAGSRASVCREGCGLCLSSTLGIDLCRQLRLVMRKLRDEEAAEQRRLVAAAADGEEGGGESGEGRCDDQAGGGGASDGGDDIRDTPSALETSRSAASPSPTLSSLSAAPVSLVSTSRYLRSRASASESVRGDPLVVDPNQEERLRRLLAFEDAAMIGLLQFKEKEEKEALAAKEQARFGLSPVAAQLRNRLKHVGLLAQTHLQHTHEPQHGIGGHFQRLHAALDAEAVQARRRNGHEGDDSPPRPELDTATCPFDYPPEGYDVYGRKMDSEAEEDAPVAPVRLFPTADELDLLPPIDTKRILALYSQNWSAVLDMLEGFVELVDAQVVPGIGRAVAARSRAALVELLDFTARASEFVCAVRVQVRVAQLLHAVSASQAGDFESFSPELEALEEELQGTSAFARFFRDRNAPAKRTRRGVSNK